MNHQILLLFIFVLNLLIGCSKSSNNSGGNTLSNATVASLNCSSSTFSGAFKVGTVTNNVLLTIPYTGGNGGKYSAISISSTGVTGLTATANEEFVNNGNGALALAVKGIPSNSGIANFLVNFGGKSCTISATVNSAQPSIFLNCSGTNNNGTLISGSVASGVSSLVPYSNGTGVAHTGQVINSTGVLGLVATLPAGTFANGAGILTYTITGTPASAGTASFALNIGGQNCILNRTVNASSGSPTYPPGTIHCSGTPTEIVDVVNPTTGKTWMDRNLGASRKAINSSDANSYGDLYQWGRKADGHQCRNSSTINTLSSTDQPTHDDFIIGSNWESDWRNPENSNLWQGINGINNPCPSGYRVPTDAELHNEKVSWNVNNLQGAFASPLKLPVAGQRSYDGVFVDVGTNGYYWSSTVMGSKSSYLYITSGDAFNSSYGRATSYSIRCIKN